MFLDVRAFSQVNFRFVLFILAGKANFVYLKEEKKKNRLQ